ncbi:MAG: hypothetical protein LBQ66_11840 [Planctomycetaceae bacterium]|nr:hypothetical protein [Planctomycetaceae bacterium]
MVLLMGVILFFNSPAQAQINIRVGGGRGGHSSHHRPGDRHGPPPRHDYHHRHNDFDRTVRVLGAVGSIVAAANGYTPYDYYHRRPVVVVPSQPVLVTQPVSPVVVEKQVIVERQVPVVVSNTTTQPTLTTDYFSPKLGATFVVQNMQIPGYTFKAARLTSDPLPGSPLIPLGLAKGDVITRLDNESVDSVAVLEKHEANTVIRYIKTGTVKVLLGKIYIPKSTDAVIAEPEKVYAP